MGGLRQHSLAKRPLPIHRGSWLTLSSPTEINRVILKWGVTAAKSFKIQTSVDAATWTDVYTTTQGSSSSITDRKRSIRPIRRNMCGCTPPERAPIPFAGRGGFGRRGLGRGGSPQTARCANCHTTHRAGKRAFVVRVYRFEGLGITPSRTMRRISCGYPMSSGRGMPQTGLQESDRRWQRRSS